jgi:hypothetical protein
MGKRKHKSKRKNHQVEGNAPQAVGANDPLSAGDNPGAASIDPIKALVFGLIVGAVAVAISLA